MTGCAIQQLYNKTVGTKPVRSPYNTCGVFDSTGDGARDIRTKT